MTAFLNIPPYALEAKEKEPLFLQAMDELTHHHLSHSVAYQKLFSLFKWPLPSYTKLTQVPYLPVGLFKRQELLSIPRDQIFKVLHSSGTTSSVPSKIFLDRQTAHLQALALASIITSFIGSQRLPLLVVDTEKVLQDRSLFSARGAGLVGMLNFGRDPFYLLDDSLEVKVNLLDQWLQKHEGERILIFGFTSMIWKFLNAIQYRLNFPEGILIHGGGWKKLQREGVDAQTFKEKVHDILGIRYCHDFYGMVEQTGSIFMECERGYFHSSIFSDVIIRNSSWQKVSQGETGVIEVLSVLPHSYPGHALLTDDLGSIQGVDDCLCGRKGTYFTVEGRVPKAEPRGCSDVGFA
jgi:Acyl-protein synthetase, LuxE